MLNIFEIYTTFNDEDRKRSNYDKHQGKTDDKKLTIAEW